MAVPADILRVGRIRNTPVVNMKNLTELRGTWLLTTPTTLNLTSVEILQDTVKTEGVESLTGNTGKVVYQQLVGGFKGGGGVRL